MAASTAAKTEPAIKAAAKKRGRPAKSVKSGDGETTIKSLSRGITLLEHIGGAKQGIQLSDLALQMGLPLSTTHRLLNTLLSHQFVAHDADTGTWSMGVNAFRTGNAFLQQRDITAQSRPFLKRLVDASGETANLSIFEAGNAIIISQVQCKALMRMLSPIGSVLPLHASAIGKSFMSAMPQSLVMTLLEKQGLRPLTKHTHTTVDALLRDLAATRQRGYAIDDQEQDNDLRCVAANVYDENQEVVAAISVSGPDKRINDERLLEVAYLTRQAAADITAAIGGQSAPISGH